MTRASLKSPRRTPRRVFWHESFLHKSEASRHHLGVLVVLRAVRCLALGLALALVVGAAFVPRAFAQESPAAASAALKAQGDALMDTFDYPGALEKYKQAYAKNADPALLYNQGRALELMGRFPEALDLLQRFDAQASPELHARVPNLAELIAAIAQQTTELTITVKTPTPNEKLKNLTIKLGSEVIGSSSAITKRVNAQDNAAIEVTADGFDVFRTSVTLEKNGKAEVPVALVPSSKTALLRITSTVNGARISVDGKDVGQVPAEVRVNAGAHTVLLTAEGYRDNEVTVEVSVGDVKTLPIEPGDAPLYEQWWFWTITLGIAAAGAGAGIVAAQFIERTPDKGTIPPCTTPAWFRGGLFAGPQAAGDECDEITSTEVHSQSVLVRQKAFQIGPVPVLRIEF